MRKFKLLALALVISTTSLFASDFNDSDTKDVMRNQIVKLLNTPNFTINNDIEVNITFTFSSEGEIVILSVDSKNQDILKYIRENLNNKKIENPGKWDKHYSMPIKVKSI